MITEQDLNAAIAECQGKRDPQSSDCIKLAAFYTIRNELFGNPEKPSGASYSYAPPPSDGIVSYNSGTEFSQAITGRRVYDVLERLDRCMEELRLLNPKMYNAILDELY